MTRDASLDSLRRGAVISLLLALIAVLIPHLPRLPIWVIVGVLLLFLWRAWRLLRPGNLAGKWTLIALTVLGTAGVVATFGPRMGRDASVALLAVMLALKVQEFKTLRDAVVVTCLGFFVIITDFLYSQSMATAGYMLIATLWLTATLIAFHDHNRALPVQRALRISTILLLQGAPLMAALFVLFPRIQGPVFGFPQTTSVGVTGLSDSMAPGSMSQLSLSDEVAFRVQFHSTPPKAQHLYWRGPVLSDFDGRTWTIGPLSTTAYGGVRHEAISPPIRYSVTLEPHYQRWLFAIDLPAVAPQEAQLANDYQLLAPRPVRNRMRYDVRLTPAIATACRNRRFCFSVRCSCRTGYNPGRRSSLASCAAARAGRRSDRGARVFHSEPFFYTLCPGARPQLGRRVPVRDAARHSASTMRPRFVFLMRAAGIPARVVTGYQGGEMNPLNDYLIVRQSEAHAWAEVWQPGEGWLRVDPTAAVSPARIGRYRGRIARGRPFAARHAQAMRCCANCALRGTRSPTHGISGCSVTRRSGNCSCCASSGWIPRLWQTLAVLLMAVCSRGDCGRRMRVLGELRLRPVDPVTRSWRRFCRKLARAQLHTPAGEGPRDFARRAAAELPQLARRSPPSPSSTWSCSTPAHAQRGSTHRRLRELVHAL